MGALPPSSLNGAWRVDTEAESDSASEGGGIRPSRSFKQSLLGLRKVTAPRMPDSARFCLLLYDVRCKDVPKTPYGYAPRVSIPVPKVLLDSPIALTWAFDC